MKHKFFTLLPIAAAALVGSAQGAVYFTDFTGYSLGNLDGQQGWSVNATGSSTFPGAVLSGAGFWGSRVTSLGWADGLKTKANPTLDAYDIYASHDAAVPVLGTAGSANVTFSAIFQVVDSDSGYSAGSWRRDNFGFRLMDIAGNNLFSFILSPWQQSTTPEVGNPRFDEFSWSTGTGAPTAVLRASDPSGWLTAQEDQAYTFSVSFFPSGANDLAFTANISGAAFSGVIPGQASAVVGKFGAFWNPIDPVDPGSNQLLFDNVQLVPGLVPEPASVLLGLVGASLALVRRRRR